VAAALALALALAIAIAIRLANTLGEPVCVVRASSDAWVGRCRTHLLPRCRPAKTRTRR
jgi:hypothetical protein